MASRLELHEELETVLGSKNVYFQPPESKKLVYDCIVYNRANIDADQANNHNYILMNRYEVTLMYRDPDSTLPHDIMRHFKYCSNPRHVVVDNVYHDVFSVYY